MILFSYYSSKKEGISYDVYFDEYSEESGYAWITKKDKNEGDYKKLIKSQRIYDAIFDAVEKVFEDI